MAKFEKGDPRINRNGGPKTAVIELLREALESEGLKRKKDFWTHLAEQAFEDRAVLIAVAKKFIPDVSKTEIEGSMEFTEMPTVKIDGLPLELHIGEN